MNESENERGNSLATAPRLPEPTPYTILPDPIYLMNEIWNLLIAELITVFE